MQGQRTFSDEIKYQFKNGGMHIKLVFVNVIIFLFIHLFMVIGELGMMTWPKMLVINMFYMPTDLGQLIYVPWTIFTSMFAHVDLFHILLNMLLLFFAGSAFRMFFSDQRMLTVYLLGGLLGNLLEILAHLAFPQLGSATVLGASGALMAVFMALAFFRPNLPVSFFGVFSFPIIFLGLFYVIADFLRLGAADGIAHFAHLGGAIVGFLAAKRGDHPNHFMAGLDRFLGGLKGFFTKFGQSGKAKKVVDPRRKTDEEFNFEAKERQRRTDEILDKISKSGYESLSKAEKEFLFRQSRK